MKKSIFLFILLITCAWLKTVYAQGSPTGISHSIYKNQNDLVFSWKEGIPASSTTAIHDSGIPCVESLLGSSNELHRNSYALRHTTTSKVRLERFRAYIRPEVTGTIAFKVRVLGLNSETTLPDESNVIDYFTTENFTVTTATVGTWIDIVPTKNVIIEAGATVFFEIKATGAASDSKIYTDRGPEQLYSYWKNRFNIWAPREDENYMIRAQFTSDLTTPLKKLQGYNFYKNGTKLNSTLISLPYYLETGIQTGNYAYTATAVYDGVETALSAPYNLNFTKINYAYNFEDGIIPEDCKVYDLNRDGKLFSAGIIAGGYYAHYGSKCLAITNQITNDVFTTKLIVPTAQDHTLSFFTIAGSESASPYMLVKISETGQAVNNYTILLDSITSTGKEWKEFSYDLSAYIGKHISIGFFAVSKSKDYFILDDIVLPPFYQASKDVGLESISAPKLAIADSITKIECVIKNKGLTNAVNVDVKLMNTITNTELARLDAPVDLAIDESKTVTINWVSAVTGEFKVRAVIDYTEDMGSYNNNSDIVRISMQDNNASFFPLGNKAYTNNYPINFAYKNSGSELLYFPSELTKNGSIEAIVLEYKFVEDILNQPVKVKIGKTSVSNFGTKNANYIDPSTLTEVFNGNLDFYAEDGFVIVPFNTSFKYNLDTLVINIEKSYTDQNFSSGNVFYTSTGSTVTNRTGFWYADTRVSSANDQIESAKTQSPTTRFPDINFIFNTSLDGRIYGTVKDTNGVGIDNVTVTLEGSHLAVTTNVLGEYTIKGINPGTYTLAIYKYPYQKETRSITIAEGEQINQNFTLIDLPRIKVTGKVVDKQSGTAVSNARVFLEENETFSATANAAGEFTIENVVPMLNYDLFAIGDNYTQHAGKLTHVEADTNLGNIQLGFNLAPVVSVAVASRETTDSVASLQWDKAPVKTGFYEDFENYEDFTMNLAPFTTIDIDKYQTGAFQLTQFKNQLKPMAYMVFNAMATAPPMSTSYDKFMAHSGDRIAASFFAYNDKLKPVSVPNNDWLISPRMHVETGGVFQFEARTYRSYVDKDKKEKFEKFEILVSTTGKNIEDFTMISKCDSVPVLPWAHYSYDLSAYAGQDIYVAIRCVSDNVHMFMVDDIRLVNPSSQTEPEFVKYNVYRFLLANKTNKTNWTLLGETTTKAFTDNTITTTGDYGYAIVAMYTDNREAAPAYSLKISKIEEVGIDDVQKGKSQIKVYPNPANDYVTVTSVEPIKEITVKSITGSLIAQHQIKAECSTQVDVSKLSKGIYFFTVRTDKGSKTVKVVKQ